VKFSNTLVVKNHRAFFSDEVMYMSGPPLHVLTMNLVRKFRERMGAAVPISFSAGLDARNVSHAVAMNLVPVTTCTDLLRPGGYGRLIRYLERLGDRMRELRVSRIPDFVMRYAGNEAAAIHGVIGELHAQFPEKREWLDSHVSPLLIGWAGRPGAPLDSICRQVPIAGLEQKLVDMAGLLNTPQIVDEATANPRYSWERNKGVPRKIGSKLWLYDCINCDKCIPVCPNDANFVYETPAADVPYDNFELTPAGARRIPGGALTAVKAHQIANYADACNDCGNCDVFCPEDGGPNFEKPRFFSSLERYRKSGGRNGFFLEFASGGPTLYATIQGKPYRLVLDPPANRARFDDGRAEVEIELNSGQLMSWKAKAGETLVDMRRYVELKLLLESVADPRRVHFANAAGLQEEVAVGNPKSAV
jgi:putative selenate reductase